MRSQTDYILVTDSCLFHNIAFRDARHKTDHHMVLGCFHGVAPAAYLRYLGRHKWFPIRPPATPDRVDRMFVELWRAIPSPPQWEIHRQYWISPETCSLINTRIEACRRKYQQSYRSLSRAIKVGLQEDRRRRADKAGSAV